MISDLQRTHLQRPLLSMSPTAGDQMSRGRNPDNGKRRDFGRRRRHRQSGFQHTDRPRPSSPQLFNKDHNAGRESLSYLKMIPGIVLADALSWWTHLIWAWHSRVALSSSIIHIWQWRYMEEAREARPPLTYSRPGMPKLVSLETMT